ncbi:SDR family oxidoreductase [Rhizobium sp. C4]|uniref:SDR family oxidoreductase n=1 Tax=Rhizobium sp. C4 TaxID=1349800 RepID=UPI001E46B034|nr:SDR family oxidoreductase [Rhizobium sp. C4]MCD2173203.1 SDR family oxidoreductase [Rhizobium sp. C4]
MNILILGATGFIGSHIAAKLAAEGHTVTGLGRDTARLAARMPQIAWVRADLSNLLTAESWKGLLEHQEIVVNCAGALQDGLSDHLKDVQTRAQLALHDAAGSAGLKLLIQISADTSGPAGETEFLATKRAADEALAESGLPHVILRPVLVIGRNAFGGTALLRALAAAPAILPLVHTASPVATVTLDDVAKAVSLCIKGEIATGSDLTLAGQTGTLASLVRDHRAWLGLPPAPTVSLPAFAAAPVSGIADALGWLGWRSPLRSTAMAVMRHGVSADDKGAAPPFPLEAASTFIARIPAGAQDLWFARLYLLKPLILFCLSAFWLASGLIPLLDPSRAAGHFEAYMGQTAALGLTVATCLIDTVLGLAVLYRPRTRLALWGMILVTLGYLAGSLLLEPALWLDPLGPMVKTVPSLVLTLVALAILDER